MKAHYILGFFAIFAVSCGGATKKNPNVDRTILGAELEFGRKAAKYNLWNEAIFRWEKVVTEDPDNSDAINNLAVAYESVGNYEKAKGLYQKALELEEDSTEIRKNYKRFLNFYKKHQKQIAREKAKQGDASSPAEGDEQ